MKLKKSNDFKKFKGKVEDYTKNNDYETALFDIGIKPPDKVTQRMWSIADEIREIGDRTDDISKRQEKRLVEEFKRLGKSKWKF